jgi:tRNA dimethylallyltransferase
MLLELRRMTKPVLHLIAGPTASGKSALALDIARRERGTIINADAMQVYAGLPVLTAQPEPQDKKEIPHELYEVFDPAERSSAGKWRTLAEDVIRRAVESGRTPILVGGTGLYFKALLEGMADIPDIPETVREESRRLYAELGSEAFRAELAKRDPESAERLKPNDKQRLIRAYEVAKHTGKPIGYWQSASSSRTGAEQCVFRPRLLMPPREELYAACDRRFLAMMERGAVDEVRDLLARKLDPDLPAMKILGVRELAAMLRGEMPRDDAVAKAQQATRNYAKRQMTWFRNQKSEIGK